MTTRKHYIGTAKLIADQIEALNPLFNREAIESIAGIARGLANQFRSDNPRFDRQRFYFACGLDDNGHPDWKALYDAVSAIGGGWPDQRRFHNWDIVERAESSGNYRIVRLGHPTRVTAPCAIGDSQTPGWIVTDVSPAPNQDDVPAYEVLHEWIA